MKRINRLIYRFQRKMLRIQNKMENAIYWSFVRLARDLGRTQRPMSRI